MDMISKRRAVKWVMWTIFTPLAVSLVAAHTLLDLCIEPALMDKAMTFAQQ
jgi:hypothetical protein